MNSLASIYSQIKRDLRIVLPAGRISWTEITRDYRPRADDIIRFKVEETYRLSAKQVMSKFKKPFFTTDIDWQQIKQLTKRYQDFFWIGLENEIIRKTARAFDPRTLMRFEPNIDLKDTFIDRTITSMETEVSARAVISKTRQILMTQTQVNTFTRQQYLLAAVGPKLVWRTATVEALCPQCQELKGRTWSIDDANILIPVISTHINCRCRLDLVL